MRNKLPDATEISDLIYFGKIIWPSRDTILYICCILYTMLYYAAIKVEGASTKYIRYVIYYLHSAIDDQII